MQAIEPFSLAYARELIEFYLGMLYQTLLSMPSMFGTTWRAILITALIFMLTLFVKMRRQGIDAMKTHWKENLKDGIIVTFIVWGSFFVLNFAITIYDAHKKLSRSSNYFMTEIEKNRNDNIVKVTPKEPKEQEKKQKQIINVYTSPSDRRIPATKRDYIVKTLTKYPAEAYVGALSTDREAWELASDIWGVLRDARWNLPGGQIAELIGHMDPGITIESYGETGGSAQETGDVQDNAAIVFMKAINQINLQATTVIGSEKRVAPGKFLRILIGPRPPG